jgi:ABC-type sulfate/molybdate transport systems ATPase subunit
MAYGDFVLMRDLDFTVNRGDVFIIMGGSGCGKSTLMKIMIGLKSPAKGRVFYGDVNFWESELEERDRMMRQMGILYQSGALWSSMTLAENIALPLEQYTDLTHGQIRELASYKLSLVGLAGFEDFYPSEISGGMRKRAGLARAMALDPDILFFAPGEPWNHGGGGDARTGEHIRHWKQLRLSGCRDKDHDRMGRSQKTPRRVTGPEGAEFSDERRSSLICDCRLTIFDWIGFWTVQ